MIIEKINKPNDIKKLEPVEYYQLADEIREFLVNNVSKTGGHLASNLGVVELTMALHIVFNLPQDKLIWDVGHQSYTHKILTGRKNNFETLRKYGGMSGFPKRNESECDAFDTGHSSTSVSAGLGYACARDIKKEKYSVVSIIGDGALTGGMAYEALNNASHLKGNFIIVLNDNTMSISKNVGGVSEMLGNIRSSDSYYDLKENIANTLYKLPKGNKIVDIVKHTKSNIKQILLPGQMFSQMGLNYLGPINGHDLDKLIKTFKVAKRIEGPVVVHVVTHKGHGYKPAEKNPSKFHGVGPFDIKTGLEVNKSDKKTYSSVFSEVMCEIAQDENKLIGITAAMPDGTGLKKFARLYPDRFFDVGIAEQHAVTFAGGMAAGGMKPVFAVYSSFLQRAYDQVLHDVCIQNLHVVLAIDRAGIVGNDGETHQGIFDVSFLRNIPNMSIVAPKNDKELKMLMKYAVLEHDGPIAVRYPRGQVYEGLQEYNEDIKYACSEVINMEKDIALFAAGSMVETAVEIRNKLKQQGFNVSLINARFLKPFDEKMIDRLNENHKLIVTMEENVITGGMGEGICQYVENKNLSIKTLNISLPDKYIEHGNVSVLKLLYEIDAESITKRVISFYENI